MNIPINSGIHARPAKNDFTNKTIHYSNVFYVCAEVWKLSYLHNTNTWERKIIVYARYGPYDG